MSRADWRRSQQLRTLFSPFAAVLLCAALAACDRSTKNEPTSAPAPPQAARRAGEAGSVVPRPLTAEALATLVYAGSPGASEPGKWRPKKLWQGDDSPGWEEGESFSVTPVALLPFRQANGLRAFVMMSANAPGNDCHACGAILGVAALTELADGWRIDSIEPELEVIGSYGSVPDGVCVSIGQDRSGLLLTPGYSNMGQSASGMILFAEQRTGGFAKILSIDESSGDNAGNCDNEDAEGEPCWSFSSDWEFVSEKGRELYDFRLTKKGTRPLAEKRGVEEFSETTTFRFDGAKYTPVR